MSAVSVPSTSTPSPTVIAPAVMPPPTPAVTVGLLPAAPTVLAHPASSPAHSLLVAPATVEATAKPMASSATTLMETLSTAGQSLGEGLAPLPPKLVKKILSLEFVEMADLLPEAWLLEETSMEAQLRRQRVR